MTQKKEMPARSGNYEASTVINEQFHNSATDDEMQALCGKISDELYSKVRFPLRHARTVLSDQQNQYFIEESAGECLTDAAFIAYGYEDAYNRNEITVENVSEAMEALEDIIDRLSDFSRGLREMWEVAL
ncbi:hypothetical protein [Anaerotruncus rubiinfantis]|uniref:hypothetical protein n=1 Tax=Anaerotruncus rubiinfantis TaxID=1720200 RepID=UPI0011CBDC4F|nr:hypothetical protein [Anaerotruncus rubiinfantis]